MTIFAVCRRVVLYGAFALGVPVAAQPGTVKEYQLKAVFLFNFAQFVDWPPSAFTSAQAPLNICVLGDDPFGTVLDETVRGERVKDRPLVVHRMRKTSDAKACHILFVSKSEHDQLREILAALKGRSVLTVGDVADFAVQGGMIRFVTDQKKIRLSINVDAAKAADVTISSKLLRPADIVTSAKP